MPAVCSLLRAVRRRLWRNQFIAAIRRAAWGSATLLLLAVAAHLAFGRVPTDGLLAVIGVLWAAALAGAGLQRPSEGDCALWADRHLGGASAYSTLLETRTGAAPPTQAVQWLEQWATASVPEAQRRLADRRDPARVVRPLFSLLVSTAIAGIVLTLDGLAPPPRQGLAAPTASNTRGAPTDVAALASSGVAGELARALRSTESRGAPERGSMGPAQAERGQVEIRPRSPGQARGPMAEPTNSAASGAADSPGAAQAGTKGSGAEGREAGAGRDDSGHAGVSRAMDGAFPIELRGTSERDAATARRADMDQPGRFDDGQTTKATVVAGRQPQPVPATPPRASRSVVLAPAEAVYVQAWLKTATERR